MTQGRDTERPDPGDSTDSLAQKIAAELRRSILLGDLKPGAPVKERDNAEEKGVSRTPMREAIRILAQEGLIVLRPSRSPIIANPSLRDVTDDLNVLIALEVLSGELACQYASDKDIRDVREIHDLLSASQVSHDPLDLFEIDMSFHRSIATAAHNPSLAETHRAYLARLWRARFLSASQRRNSVRVVSQHGAILTALEARDPDATRDSIRAHLQDLVANIGRFFDQRDNGPDTDS